MITDNGLIGKYVVIRCTAAGVHAGVLVAHSGQECVLSDSRRLWSWKVAKNGAFLCGVATHGLDNSSRIGETIGRIHLIDACEIIQCTEEAAESIKNMPAHRAP